MSVALVNSQWITPTPLPIAAPVISLPLPISQIEGTGLFAITRLTIRDATVYISLDGNPADSGSNDFALEPGTYGFLCAPDRIFINGPGAHYQVGYEVGLTDFYLTYWAQGKGYVAAPGSSAALNTVLASNPASVYLTQILVSGGSGVYVTLDGRVASSTSYDFVLTDGSHYRPQDAAIFAVDPKKIRVCNAGGSSIKYGFWEYPAMTSGSYNTPIFGRGPFA